MGVQLLRNENHALCCRKRDDGEYRAVVILTSKINFILPGESIKYENIEAFITIKTLRELMRRLIT